MHETDFLWPRGLYSPLNSPGQNTGVGSLSLLQGIFPTQGSNPGLPHCKQILYQLSHKGRPRILEWVAHPFSSGSSQTRFELGFPALQADSSPIELSGKPVEEEDNIYWIASKCMCVRTQSISHVWLFVTPWTIVYQAPLSMEISRQEYWSGLPFPTPGDLPDPEMETPSLASLG